ncbi:hypothetical protein V1525DRAFT_395133 [Lipomyces kononenkoae]|uniref:Uncharacterized protein n=1 Tax=Lipomyces kononenkoae TaxID=34357 RepID=A0ACC3T9X6_LIPKO
MISIQDILNPSDDHQLPVRALPSTCTPSALLSPTTSLHSDGDDGDADDASSITSRSEFFVPYECVCAGPDSECHVDVPARKVVSHIFGRNKRQTLAIPEDMWVFICRRHYQRESYRKETFPILQAKLVLMQLDKLEQWGHVSNFTVIRSKPKRCAPRVAYAAAAAAAATAAPLSPRSQSYIRPRGGNNIDIQSMISRMVDDQTTHSFAQIRALIVAIQAYLDRETDPALRVFPNIEILPNIEGPLAYIRRGRKRGSVSSTSTESSTSSFPEEPSTTSPKRRRMSVPKSDRQPVMLAPKPIPPAGLLTHVYRSPPQHELRRHSSDETVPGIFSSPPLGILQYRQMYVHS